MNRRIFLGSLAAVGLAWGGGTTPRQSEVAYIQRFLAERKLPVARQGVVQQHQGWVYELRADRFILARRLGERSDAGKVESTRGELVWFRASNGRWQAEAPLKRTRPADAAERYYQSHDLPGEWAAKVLGAPKAPAAVHYFTVLHCEFTPPGSPEATSPVIWDMPGWFANADRIAKEFATGKL